MRACVFKLLLEMVSETLPKDSPFAQQLKTVIEQPASIFANIVFRAKARHKDPMETRSWTWAFIITESIDQDAKHRLTNLKSMELKECFFTSQQSQDGPLTNSLTRWLYEGDKKQHNKQRKH